MDLALLKFERGPTYAAGSGEKGDRLIEVLGDAGRCAASVIVWGDVGVGLGVWRAGAVARGRQPLPHVSEQHAVVD